VVTAALRRAGTRVCEPIERFHLNLPPHTFNAVAALLGRSAAVIDDTTTGDYWDVRGTVPSARIPEVVAALPDLTGGEAVLTTQFDHYAPAAEDLPAPPRRGPDPGDRELWFRLMPR
jgi:ribosomal protection tetracycline resistance protein